MARSLQVSVPTSDSVALHCPLCWQLYCPGSLDHQLLVQIIWHFTCLGPPNSCLSLATRHLHLVSFQDPPKSIFGMPSCNMPCLTCNQIPSDLRLICSGYEICTLRIFTLLPECMESPFALGYSQTQQQRRESCSLLYRPGNTGDKIRCFSARIKYILVYEVYFRQY